jgi:hypothetical protein
MKNYKMIALALAALVTAAFALNFNEVKSFAASCVTQTVTESDIARQQEDTPPTRSWVYYTRTPATGGAFRSGPDQPPIGIGSFELSTPTGADKGTLFNFDHVGTTLSSINGMSYSTFRSTGNDQQVAALNLQVDINGSAPGGFTTLVFEPVYNTDQGPVVSGTWQTWDAFRGGNAVWWSSNPINGAPNRDTFVSWNTIVADNPDAVIIGGIGINQGSGNPNLTTAVDAFRFSTTNSCVTYNFDVVPQNKEQCKNGGWQTLKRADGSSFKNQGDCVSYTNNGRQ